jgi:hypothetical protein
MVAKNCGIIFPREINGYQQIPIGRKGAAGKKLIN